MHFQGRKSIPTKFLADNNEEKKMENIRGAEVTLLLIHMALMGLELLCLLVKADGFILVLKLEVRRLGGKTQ